MWRLRPALVAAAALAFLPGAARALAPAEVLVVVNAGVPGSRELGAYYRARRGVPEGNLLELRVTAAETCRRREYDEGIAAPVRARLARAPGLRAAVFLRGVPLRVAPPEPSPAERETLARLERERDRLTALAASAEEPARVERRLEALRGLVRDLRRSDWEASVDSELALVRSQRHPLGGWVPNPLFASAPAKAGSLRPEEVLLVARLDGPTPELVRRVIDDGLAAEAEGLGGGACLDARWPDPGPAAELSGYALYDRSLHRAAEVLRGRGIPAVVDEQPTIFPEGAGLAAALYAGWYSLGRYVGAFAWRRGAVGYHIASAECVTLRSPGGQGWCQRMLEEGAVATLGPVAEPYVQAFPPPDLFFDLLTDGRHTLAEAYYESLPFLSWRMVLVGDPLYRPFSAP